MLPHVAPWIGPELIFHILGTENPTTKAFSRRRNRKIPSVWKIGSKPRRRLSTISKPKAFSLGPSSQVRKAKAQPCQGRAGLPDRSEPFHESRGRHLHARAYTPVSMAKTGGKGRFSAFSMKANMPAESSVGKPLTGPYFCSGLANFAASTVAFGWISLNCVVDFPSSQVTVTR